MKTMTSKARLTTMLVFLPVWLVARDAMAAGTCDYTGSLPIDGPGLTSPAWDYCGIIEPIYTGPGAGFLTQDVSGTTSGTYALVATSLSNDAIYAYADSPGIGVLALAGTTTVPAEAAGVVASGSGAGVSGGYFISASGEGVWGVTKSSSGFALYGGGGSSTVGTAVFGDNRNESTGGNAAVNGQTGDPTGYGGFFANGATTGTGNGYGLYASSSLGGGTGVYATGFTGVQGVSATGIGGSFSSSASGGDGVVGNSTDGGVGVYGECSGTGCEAGYFAGNVKITGCLDITSTGGGTTGTCSSDARLKKNIEPLKDALGRLARLKGVTYEWRDPARGHGGAGVQTGFIAQDVLEAFPEWVGTDAEGFMTIGLPPTGVIALEVEALKALKAENNDLKKQLKAANEHGANTDERLDRLEGLTNLPRAGFGYGYGGWAGAGLAGLALGIVLAGRRKDEKKS